MFNYFKKVRKTDSYGAEKEEDVLLVGKIITHIIVTIIGLIVLFGSWTIIAPTEEGVVIRIGKIDRQMESGFHWKMPLVEKVVKMDVSTKKIEVQASAASKDLQVVTTNMAVQFELIEVSVSDIYKEYKKDGIRSRVIDPAIQDAVKASTALFNADELITKRAEVKDNIFNLLNERLASEGVFLRNVDIVNFDFSDSFNIAIEEKVTAEQNAAREENNLRKAEFVAEQRIAEARGEAEAIRIQAQAINSQGGEDYVQLKAVEKWNGMLPQQFVPGSAVPFLNLIK